MMTIPFKKINTGDRRFAISFPAFNEALCASVESSGILHPVVLLKGDPLVIIAGFRRCEAASRLSIKEIPAIMLDIDEKEAARYAVLDNAGRKLNIVEKSHAVERLQFFGCEEGEIFDCMKILGIQGHGKIFRKLLQIALLEPAVKDLFASRDFSLKNADMFLRLDADEMRKTAEIFTHIRTTDSTVREILELMLLIKVRGDPVDFDSMAEKKTVEELKMYLRKTTYPKLVSLEEELEKIKGACRLPPWLGIQVDPYFEKEHIGVSFSVKREEEVAEAIEKIGTLLKKGQVGKILELTKGRIR